ncbi:DNA-binding transcriptional response regulator [Gemmata obscuriglobus]|uniref:Sigma-54-dependent Fis family transcriptional regulator n=1 Tax=Gemmata obscuriglobus TaxID=114 RepID=A0A2Z3GWP9_9BACT|nr:sigma-54 dependent transcriptional regulator [Gemmata obscuriglobus]AWM35987.1 sigma-54-dependent Fis family transcriptional regulator [Gemmata obscuriglobus]QEG31444.1 DNA-binding transcriptional response regulator [Gemmata obscuriglobus]VTS10786.1 two sigma54 transcriptional fis family : Response regulator with CheY-like receiver, AAA-type ATPase, and DNA-binding domains OS=Singulisphaera acidiphila (strain ATCC BAA-1392 / DSM 18658 / VKM B-2454 / MOB10) GN=Sinac_2631 PE=4 SV=1: Response_re
MSAPAEPLQVLVIDDDKTLAETISESLDRRGHSCTVATGGKAGVAKLEQEAFDVVLTDLKMADLHGLEVVERCKQLRPEAEVYVITGFADVKTAVEAMKRGAAHYLQKPLDLAELRAVIENSAKRVGTLRELRRQLDEKFGFEGVVGNSPKMQRVLQLLKAYAPSSASVLILGENGTGKDLAARALHTNGPRRTKPFTAMNCAGLTESLLDSEMFGHEKGAFTGADRQRVGRFEHAHGGTLFLDEIGDMPLSLQAKLLRALENGEVVRVGTNEPLKVDVRIIAATNKDLQKEVEAGRFRQDLYFRLKVGTVKLPPLREHREDIPQLVSHFLKEFARRDNKPVPKVAPAVWKSFEGYDWPGNVRELRNLLASMMVLDLDGELTPDDFPEDPGVKPAGTAERPHGPDQLVGRPLDEVERYYIEKALDLTGGNREEAARLLNISERTLYRKIQEWKKGGEKPPEKPAE